MLENGGYAYRHFRTEPFKICDLAQIFEKSVTVLIPKSLDDIVCGELGLKFGSLSDNYQEKCKENEEILV